MMKANKIDITFSCVPLKFNNKGENENKEYILSL